MRILIAYLLCGILTAMIIVAGKVRDGLLDLNSVSDDDYHAIGLTVLLWPVALYIRFTER